MIAHPDIMNTLRPGEGEPRMTRRELAVPAVYVIVRKLYGSFIGLFETFYMRRANTGYGDGMWSLPSGHIERNESAKQAAVRELKEETGIDANPDSLIFVHALHRNGTYQGQSFQRVDFFFEYTLKTGEEPVNVEPHKCNEIRCFYYHPTNVIDYVISAISHIHNGCKYSEWAWHD